MKNRYNIKFYKSIRRLTNIYIDKKFCPIIKGLDNIDEESSLLIGNHKSGKDILLIAYALKEYYPRFMAKKELFSNKILDWFMTKAGAFPVDRDKKDFNAIKTAINLLKDNNIVVIFPEGTRNKTDEVILPFKKGTGSLALLAKTKIIPFAITGDYKFRSKPVIEFGEKIDLAKLSLNKNEIDEYLENKVKKMIIDNSR